ncbi:hypothetical protein GCM10028818_08340 [Spirosoma horti]
MLPTTAVAAPVATIPVSITRVGSNINRRTYHNRWCHNNDAGWQNDHLLTGWIGLAILVISPISIWISLAISVWIPLVVPVIISIWVILIGITLPVPVSVGVVLVISVSILISRPIPITGSIYLAKTDRRYTE